ncbi:MAG: Gfo/Idh/MocA family oxidoreductase [Desulfarculaceae bacterium]|nr:Gfo/Idh/MocA family oxidoreductase [Desulfarculaceae bacterium]MCF8072099.1 Gfo/Idh/MocA family oxidoreductase [Desulfarculaceae bacterium]MCF8100020.1 Gfo/Idh/MocA family oxidoreductase [Desulfarculaceae bacterium]
MAAKKYQVGIAGYGVVGQRRREQIDQHPGLTTVALCDVTFPEAGTMSDGVRYFPTYRELLDQELDMLFVSLPNYLAAEVTIAGLERGLHVFCEKPPGRAVEDIERVIEAEKANPGLALKYGFNHRYHDSVRRALDLVASGELGPIVNLRGIYGKSSIIPFSGGWRAERAQAGGGILLDQGIHMVDLMRLFCGEFREVKSFVSNSYWNHDVEDNAFALMKDAQGRVAMLQSTATHWQHRFSMYLSLGEGYLELRGILSGSKSYGEERLIIGRRTNDKVGSLRREVITYLEDNSWRDEVWEFAEDVAAGRPVSSGNSADALATMQTVYRIYYADSQWREAFDIANPDG